MLRQWCVRSLNRRIFRHSTRFNTEPPEGNKDDNLVNYDRWQKEIEEFQEEEVQLKRGKYGLDDIAAPRKRGRQEVIWHDHELPEKAYPEDHEPQIRLVRNIEHGKHVRAHKGYEMGEKVLMQKPRMKLCPVENNVCRRCLKEQMPYSMCGDVQTFQFRERIEPVRQRISYEYGPQALVYFDLCIKFCFAYTADHRYGSLLRLSKGARAVRLPHDTLLITQWLVEFLPMRMTDDFQDYDFQAMLRLLRSNKFILKTQNPSALYNQITFFIHHCFPTCTVVETDLGAAIIVVSPDGLAEGQPISLSWVDPIMSREQREKLLKKELMQKECRCAICNREEDVNRIFRCQCGKEGHVYARFDQIKWICECGQRHEKEFIMAARKEESKLSRLIARQAVKPTDFDVHKFLETSLMHPHHHLVYQFAQRQGFYIYDNSLIQHYPLAIKSWILALQCAADHPSVYYHTNTIDILTKMTQMAINLNDYQSAKNFMGEAQHILDFIGLPITLFKMRMDTFRQHLDEQLKIEDPRMQAEAYG